VAGDGDEAPALGEARQGRGDMAEGGLGEALLDMRRS
jgi:hypothetical protein